MKFDGEVVAAKLRRWEKYLYNFQLPDWESIPDFGLYMDQIIGLLTEYLDYLPPEIKSDRIVTAATINNYVRMKIIPEPQNKKYFRVHIAYLIMICTLKQTLSIATIQSMIPLGLKEEEVQHIYDVYVSRHRASADYFIDQVRNMAMPLLKNEEGANRLPADIIFSTAILGGFAKLLSEKMILLNGVTADSPDVDLSIPERRERKRG